MIWKITYFISKQLLKREENNGFEYVFKRNIFANKSMNLICINITQGIEEVIASIDYFERDTELQREKFIEL